VLSATYVVLIACYCRGGGVIVLMMFCFLKKNKQLANEVYNPKEMRRNLTL
jgi:hypothetical protein